MDHVSAPLLTLLAGERRYAIPLQGVAQVLPRCTPAALPRAAGNVTAMLSWAGKVIPVLCLRSITGDGKAPAATSGMVAVCTGEAGAFGLLCDAVTGIAAFEEEGASAVEGTHNGIPAAAPQNCDIVLLDLAVIDPNRGLENTA